MQNFNTSIKEVLILSIQMENKSIKNPGAV